MGPDKLADVHGGADPTELARLGLRVEQVLDFSANLNPFGPSPAVQRAIEGVAINRYPDRACAELRDELARRHGVGDEQILIGNGSSELIWLTAIAYLAAGDEVAILGPAFSGYERSARLMGAKVLTIQATPENDFCPPLGAFRKGIRERSPKLAFLASPNNPTGQVVSLEEVFSLAARHPQTLFVLDEAYWDCRLEEGGSSSSNLQSAICNLQSSVPFNVLRLRSLTKAHGLAGLRLGYAVGAAYVIAALRRAQPPWSVNALAQVAGSAALRDEAHFQDGLARWLEAGASLVDRLREAGFVPIPSAVPFFLLRVRDACQARSILLRQSMLVRDCSSFGLPKHIRISTRRPDENTRLIRALVEARGEIESCAG